MSIPLVDAGIAIGSLLGGGVVYKYRKHIFPERFKMKMMCSNCCKVVAERELDGDDESNVAIDIKCIPSWCSSGTVVLGTVLETTNRAVTPPSTAAVSAP